MDFRVLPLPRIPQELSIVVSGEGNLIFRHAIFRPGSPFAAPAQRVIALVPPTPVGMFGGSSSENASSHAMDFGCAAAWLGLGAASPALRIIIHGVNLDPKRLAFVDLLVD